VTAPGPTRPVPGPGTLLGVWAHPDDEAFLSAGLMARTRAAGGRVVVVTATAGDQGADDPTARGPALARRRRRELRAALTAVGVHEHRVLGLPDGGCTSVADGDGAARIGAWIDAVQPDAIVTFGADGITGHPDHRAIHRWTTAAWRRAGAPGRLLYATLTPGFHARWGGLSERLGLWEGEPPSTPDDELALTVDCTPVLDRKSAALDAHASQIAPLVEAVGRATIREWWATEWFVAASRTGAIEPSPPSVAVGTRARRDAVVAATA
jgi:LmbE family N-acetylglucosaminyl deacetylase